MSSAALRLMAVGLGCSVLSHAVSAQASSQAPVFDQYRVPTTALIGQAIGDPNAFGLPASIAWVNGNLAIIDDKADEAITVIDAKDGRILRRFGRRGAGPGEFSGAWALLVPNSGVDEFWTFDITLRRLTRINLRVDFAGEAFRPRMMIPLRGAAHLVSPQWLANGRLASSGFLTNGLLAVFDSNGSPLAPIGKFAYGDANSPAAARQQGYSLRLMTDPQGQRIVIYSHFSDRIDFLDVTGRPIGGGERPFSFDPIFQIVGTTGLDAAVTKDTRYGYLTVKTSKNHLFALFSGRREGDFKANDWLGRHVHVYGWDGKLQRVFVLDRDIADIAVDPEERFIYALRMDPTPGVVVYPIPTVVRHPE